MQGEGSSSDPFQENYYYFDNGSGPRSLNLIQLMEAPDPQQDPLGQPGLNQEIDRVNFIDQLTQERSLFLPIHQVGQPAVEAFNFSQDLQPMQLNRANMLGGFNQEENSMERASYMINPPDFMTPVFEQGYLENRQRNMNMAFPGDGSMAHAAGIIAASPHAPSSSTFPQTNWANPHIMENLIVNGSESRHYHQMHGFHAANQMGGASNVECGHANSSQAAANQMGGASNVRRGHASSSQAVVNQTGGASNIGRGRASSSQAGQRATRRRARAPSPRIRSPIAVERRRRLINEVREALDNFRRVGGEHFRELIALGAQFEIIANEVDQIQVVANGLTEDTIMARLTRETYHPAAAGAEEHRACSICQDEYGEGDLLGKLDCGHDYHFECIKQWLMRRNSCPLCRRRALTI